MSTSEDKHGMVQLGWRKRLFFTLTLVVAFGLFVEALSFLTFWVIEGHPLSFAGLKAERRRIARATQGGHADVEPTAKPPATPLPEIASPEVVHPYLGYVRDPDRNDPAALAQFHYGTNEFGFMDDKPPIQVREPDKLVIGILGGSVAYFFSVYGAATLLADLQQSSALAGKTPVVVRLALSGYKEPQQLMTLNYLLALGAQFDIVLNIDGFNEVALPPVENVQTLPFFPRSWFLRVNTLPELRLRVLVGRIAYLRAIRSRVARALTGPIAYSATANLVWKCLDRALGGSLSRSRLELQAYRPDTVPYVARGPVRRYASDADFYADLAAVWERSSLQLHRLCRANHIRYFHFLQPNQYVEGSKPMSVAELKQAFDPNHPYRKGAEDGYPYLIAAGTDLARQGVRFYDLTNMFSGVTEPIYADTCCHLNQQGNDMLAKRIGDVIRRDLGTPPTGDGTPN
jgi:hypothetical protein